ncbi:MAG: hypothetical protein WCA06_19855, partial [Terrimicrobiaceae bacterium]
MILSHSSFGAVTRWADATRNLMRKVTGSFALIGGIAAIAGTSLAPCCFPLLGFLPALAGWAGWTAASPWIT